MSSFASTQLSTPHGLKAVFVTFSSVQLEWADQGGNEPFGYNIYVESEDGKVVRHHSQTCQTLIRDLTTDSIYKIKVRSVDNTMTSEFSNELQIKTQKLEVASPPGKPVCTEIACHKIQIVWSKPKRMSKPIEGYSVYDKVKGFIKLVEGTEESLIFKPELNTEYEFTVVAICGQYGVSNPSEPSDPIQVQLSEKEQRMATIQENSELIENKNNGPPIYLLKLRCINSQLQGTRKMEFGNPVAGKQEKTIMLLGATGSGKTTLINGMVNYVFGVEWDEDFRLCLIPEESQSASQAQSQTANITSYTIHHRPEFKVPYTLTIVDTPGFGDTAGIGRDQEITEQIGQFFRAKGDAGLDQISAIGFVTQSSAARLTHTQRYIFDSILSLFGKDIGDNIVPLLTFSDSKKPQVLDALTESNIPFKEYYKFNNAVLFADNSNDEEVFDKLFWDMGTKNFKKFFDAVLTMPNKSLTLTKELLQERESLQVQIEGINQDINTGLTKLHQLDQELEIMRKHKSDMDKSKDFTYIVDQERVEMKAVPKGTFTTNCIPCKRTCHHTCAFERDEDKIRCVAMKNGFCVVCEAGCKWDEHKNLPHTYNIIREQVTKTSEDLQKRYQAAQGGFMTEAKIVKGLMGDFEKTYKDIIMKSILAKQCLTRIREIALKPNPLSTAEYLDLMIEAEKFERKEGYLQRIKQLKKVKKTAEIVEQLAKEGYDPFKDHTIMIMKVKERYNSQDSDQDRQRCSVM